MKIFSSKISSTKLAITSIKCLVFMFFITTTGTAQVNTFTATNLSASDTITSGVLIKAQCITANDTMRAKADIVAEQDLKVQGDINLTGNINAPATSTANLGEVNASQNIKTQGAFIFNSPSPGSEIGLRVFNSTNPTNTGRIINIGDPLTFPTMPLPCSLPNGNPWFLMNGGYITKSVNGLVNASLSMYTAPWNGSGFIESEGVNEVGATNTTLFLNYFCGRNVSICENTGLANGGGKVSVGNFLSAAQHVEIGSQQWGIASNNAPANNIALDMHVNTGKAIKIRTYNGSLTMFEIENTGIPAPNTTFKITGDGNIYAGVNRIQSNHIHANAQFQFNGKMACKELVVVDPTKWADFVFDKNYKLTPLSEVENFYKENKHLKDVPSEKEVKENGINSAEMDATLLQKIEELYLYMVQQNKRIEKLEIENKILKQNK